MVEAPHVGTDLVLPHDYRPRPYQRPLWNAFDHYKRLDICAHRRFGKDLLALNRTIHIAARVPGVYWHVLPSYKQARKVVWEGRSKEGKRFMDHWPSELVVKSRDDDMTIWLPNGSMWSLIGGDNYNSYVGTNPIGIVFSEWSLTDPDAWTYVRPILAENDGWAAFIYTPRGRNHAWEFRKKRVTNPLWYTALLTVEDTQAIPKSVIDADRADGMTEAMVQQEYYCSFDAPLEGAYYAEQINDAMNGKRIGLVPYNGAKPVITGWDLGVGDATAIWFAQHEGSSGAIKLIDFYRASGKGYDHFVKVLQDKPYAYHEHLLPWDAGHREGNAKTKAQQLRELGLRVRIIPKTGSINDRINTVRAMFPRFYFDETACENGLQCLREYTKEWDDLHKVYRDRPAHTWASHGADALGTLAVGLREPMKKPERTSARVAIV